MREKLFNDLIEFQTNVTTKVEPPEIILSLFKKYFNLYNARMRTALEDTESYFNETEFEQLHKNTNNAIITEVCILQITLQFTKNILFLVFLFFLFLKFEEKLNAINCNLKSCFKQRLQSAIELMLPRHQSENEDLRIKCIVSFALFLSIELIFYA